MKAFIFLILILVNSIHLQESYGLDVFINLLIENGIYDFLAAIKCDFGDDVAIETCLQLYPTNDCQQVVIVYMIAGEECSKQNIFDCELFKQILNNYKSLIDREFSSAEDKRRFCICLMKYFSQKGIRCDIKQFLDQSI